MQRVLFHLGPLHINTFGLMIVVGFLAAIWLARSEARRKGLGVERVTDFALYALIAGVIGARLVYVLVYAPAYYVEHPLDIIMLQDGGLSIHGGILGGLLAGIWYVRKQKISFWKLADTLAPSLAIGEAIGRVGCDIFGKEMASQWPWGVTVGGSLLHPAQMYEAMLDYLLFFYLWRRRQSTKYDGQLFLAYAVIYPLIRGAVEFFRINPVVFGPFTVAHAASLAFILAAVAAWRVIRPQKELTPVQRGETIVQENVLVQVLLLALVMGLSLALYYGLPV